MATIPHSWPRKPLGNIANVISGYAFKSSEFGDRGIPVIKIKNIRVGSVDLADIDRVDEKYLSIPERYHVRAGDILISLTGSHISQPNSVVGRVARHSFGFPHCLLNQRSGKVMVRDQTACDLSFLFYALSEPETVRAIALKAHGAANQANVSPTQVESIEIPFPPLPVQRRIAGIVSAYDDLVLSSQRRIRILEAMARTLYREWFVHFRFPGHEKVPRVASPIGDITQGWEVKTLSELFEFIGGSQPPKSEHIYDEQPGYIRFIQNRDYGSSQNLTYIKESRKNKLCDRLDIMVDKYGEPGKTRFGLAGAYNVALAKLSPQKPHHREWLRGLVSEPAFNTYLAGASMAATRASLNSSHFTMDVAVPSDEVSEAFQRQVEPLLKLVLTHQDTIQILRRTRDLLLPRLLSGQIPLEISAVKETVEGPQGGCEVEAIG